MDDGKEGDADVNMQSEAASEPAVGEKRARDASEGDEEAPAKRKTSDGGSEEPKDGAGGDGNLSRAANEEPKDGAGGDGNLSRAANEEPKDGAGGAGEGADDDDDDEDEDDAAHSALLAKLKPEKMASKTPKVKVEAGRPGAAVVKQEEKVDVKKAVRFGEVRVKQEMEVNDNIVISSEDATGADKQLHGSAIWGTGLGEGLFEKDDVTKAAFVQISVNPYNTEACGMILKAIHEKPLEQVEDVFKRLLGIYPSSSVTILMYVKAIENDTTLSQEEMRDKVDELFKDRLGNANQHVDVWQAYANYVMRKGDFEQTKKAYQLALDRIGSDFESINLWKEYIEFLMRRTNEFAVQNEIRRSYHQRLKTPMAGLEECFTEYANWERVVGNFKIPDDLKGGHSRAVYHFRSLAQLASNINTRYVSRPLEEESFVQARIHPSALLGKGVTYDFEQAALWYRLIEFEISNPMSLERGDLDKRVVVTCKKALVCMSRAPVFWYILARWYLDHDRYQEANITFCKGIATIPQCLFLRCAYADFLRQLQPNNPLKTPMKQRSMFSLGDMHEMEDEERIRQEKERSRAKGDGPDDEEEPKLEIHRTIWQSKGQGMLTDATKGSADVPKAKYEKFKPFMLGRAVFEDALARIGSDSASGNQRNREALRVIMWVHFMRYLRTGGRLEPEEESVDYTEYLRRAHEDPATLSGALYAAVARLERTNPPTRREAGLDPRELIEKGYHRQREAKKLNPSFLLRYIDSLWASGDSTSLRELFLQLFEADKKWMDDSDKNAVLEVFNKYVEYEVWRGELKQLHLAEARREERFGKNKVGTYARQLINRYTFLGLAPCTASELAAIDNFELAYSRLVSTQGEAAQETLGRSQRLVQESLVDDMLPPHRNPKTFRQRLNVPDLRTKWVPFVVPMNRHRWQSTDDQTRDQPKSFASVKKTAWDPRKAPMPSGTGRPVGSFLRASQDTDEAGDFRELPSTVARLARLLPPRNLFTGSSPSSKYIIQCFKKAIIPPLVQGRVAPEKIEEAQRVLKKLGIEPSSILDRNKDANAVLENLRKQADTKNDSRMRKQADQGQLSLSILATHYRSQQAQSRAN
ncbi:Cleavage stimulation factor subunit 77 [Diplonema papillatum]|nr:Cleavage stimulation factor subunit 77 [Diplonema papillatum]